MWEEEGGGEEEDSEGDAPSFGAHGVGFGVVGWDPAAFGAGGLVVVLAGGGGDIGEGVFALGAVGCGVDDDAFCEESQEDEGGSESCEDPSCDGEDGECVHGELYGVSVGWVGLG